MNKERLLKLAAHLRTVNPRNFNLAYWAKPDIDCGSVACAVGHAHSIPEFRNAGLRLVSFPNKEAELVPQVYTHEHECLEGMAAAAYFFDITRVTAENLFLLISYARGRYTSPNEVANRIEELCNNQ